MGLSIVPFPRQTAISVENPQFFPALEYYRHPLKGFSLQLCNARKRKTTMMQLSGIEKTDDTCSRLDIIPECDWQADRRTLPTVRAYA